jgi:adenine deaminase
MKIEKLAKDRLLINGKIIDPHNRKTSDGDVWLKNGKITIGGFSVMGVNDLAIY